MYNLETFDSFAIELTDLCKKYNIAVVPYTLNNMSFIKLIDANGDFDCYRYYIEEINNIYHLFVKF